MRNITIGMAIAAAALSVLAYSRGGMPLVLSGLKEGGLMLAEIAPLLAAAFLLAGLIQVMVSREFIERWLGRGAGVKAVLLGAVAGALVPGGPYISYPIAASFFIGGAEIGTVMAFIAAKNVWTLTRLPMEVALLGVRITVLRYIVTFLIPVIVGLLANFILSKSVERVREQVRALAGGDRP
ncbi:MAG: permease [Desulfatiglandaceae bacterium]